MNTDITKLEELLAQGKNAEAAALIVQLAEAPLAESEEGAALNGYLSAYMDLINSINIRYRDTLKKAIDSLQKLKASESKFTEKIRLGEVKKSLGM